MNESRTAHCDLTRKIAHNSTSGALFKTGTYLDEFTGRGRHQNSGIVLLGEFDGLVTNFTKKKNLLK